MNKIIKLKNTQHKQSDIDNLSKEGLDDFLIPLYLNRNVFTTSIKSLEPFSNLKNIIKACEVLDDYIFKDKRKICIVADYDADGATACSIGITGLRMFGADIEYVVPNRFIHGYGLTKSVVKEVVKKHNPKLIITVDNGISSFEGIDYANELDIKVLVTDHHLQGDKLPDALCIVNPNQKSCTFNSKSLAGCGVIFYVLIAFSKYCIHKSYFNKDNVPDIYSLLDLVAIGTIADVVKLDANNKILVQHGLNIIHNDKARPGIKALLTVSGKDCKSLSTIDVGFAIGPRINAAGRIEDMSIGISCLLSNDYEQALTLAKRLDEINAERKQIGYDMQDISSILINHSQKIDNFKFSKTIYDPSFHEGVVGIVASKIKEQYYNPTIVFADSTDNPKYIKGSGRSIAEIHLRDAIDYVHKKDPSIIVSFGGHAMAAGVTIYKDKYADFQKLFEESIAYYSDNQLYNNIIYADEFLTEKDITFKNVRLLNKQLWGQGFQTPIFISTVKIVSQFILKEKHLKIVCKIGDKQFNALWFFHNTQIDDEEIDLAYTLSINKFRDEESIQLLVEGIYQS